MQIMVTAILLETKGNDLLNLFRGLIALVGVVVAGLAVGPNEVEHLPCLAFGSATSSREVDRVLELRSYRGFTDRS